MYSMLTINVKNSGPATQDFFFFQDPAGFSGGQNAMSNAIYSQSLRSFSQGGDILTVKIGRQIFAGVQAAYDVPTLGQKSGYSSASTAIDLAPDYGTSYNSTKVTASPRVNLSKPSAVKGVQAGAFRMTTPSFTSPPYYIVGTAVEVNRGIMLSSFAQASPNSNTDVSPVQRYHVATGQSQQGSVIDFIQSAVRGVLCDFTTGHTTIDVELQANGVWRITSAS